MTRKALPALLATTGLLLGAPAFAGAPTCDTLTFPPQAASPVGSWTIESTLCMDLPDMGAMIAPGCVGSSQNIDMTYSGNITFEDATYARAMTQITNGELRIPLSCIEGQLECEGENPMGPATVEGDYCVITMVDEKTTSETGGWATSEATIIVSPDGEDEQPKTLSIYADPADPSTMWLSIHGRGGLGQMVMQLSRTAE
jgi:hypothetical protein